LIDTTTAFARAIVAGKIVAGELAIAACKRHLDDLVTGPARGLEWRPDAAEAMIGAYPAYFTITDGPNAGAPFELLSWMVFCTGSLFGWYKDGRLRFDFAWIETAKGQGKSPWMACTAILCTGALGRKRAQVIAIAPKEDQARVLFRDASAAIEAQIPGEEEGTSLASQGKFIVRGIGDNAHKIEHPSSRSVFRTMSGNATMVSGPRPDFVFGDEIHEMPDRALIDMWAAALAKNAAGGMMILCTNTAALTQHTGTYYSDMVQRILQGHDVNDSIFGWITRVDIADRAKVFDTPAVWPKAMPALGITFPIANIEREVAKARLNPSEAARVNRLYMGIPTGAVDFWLDDPTLWDRAVGRVDPVEQIGRKCWLALDLSDKHDLTALTAVWEHWVEFEPGHAVQMLTSHSWYWTCSANLERRARADRMPYDVWQKDGHISVVDGASITKDFIAVQVAQIHAEHDVDFLAFDVAGMFAFEEACQRVGLSTWRYKGPKERAGTGLKMVAHSQGTQRSFKADQQLCMPVSIEALEDCLRLGTTTIDDNPVTYACAANAAPITDAVGNRGFDKKKSRGRIDGLVTNAMAHGAAKMNATARGPSVYTKKGIVML
jgi:phage terminase large subunit-like protein